MLPNYDDACCNEALARLLIGDFAGGWPLYESRVSRFKAADRAVLSMMPCPQWRGENLNGRSIVLLKEQGFGDQIQYLRFVTVLSKMAARVDVLVDATLKKLASSVQGINHVLTDASEVRLHNYDCWSLLGSIPFLQNLDAASIPNEMPYMRVDEALIETWSKRIGEFAAGRFRLGLVWACGANAEYKDNRSLPIRDFEAIASNSGLCLVSFQKGPQRARPFGLDGCRANSRSRTRFPGLFRHSGGADQR